MPSILPLDRFLLSFRLPAGSRSMTAARTHQEHEMITVAKLLFQNDAFQIAQRRAHILEALAEADKLFLDQLFGKAGIEQPRF
jgi:hypothetical protein